MGLYIYLNGAHSGITNIHLKNGLSWKPAGDWIEVLDDHGQVIATLNRDEVVMISKVELIVSKKKEEKETSEPPSGDVN